MKNGSEQRDTPGSAKTPQLKEIYPIRSYELDAGGSLSVPSLCNFMQDAAGKHAQQLGVSVNDLHSIDHTWVLSRLALNIDAYPQWQDNFQITTWPAGSYRLFALRKFAFSQGTPQSTGSAVTAWLVINTRNHRPVRIEPFVKGFHAAPPSTDDIAIIDLAGHLPLLKTYDFTSHFTVRYHDLDINAHVNNVKTIEWMLESIPPDTYAHRRLSGLKISFISEAFNGERVISRCHQTDDNGHTFTHSIVKADNGHELVRGETIWLNIRP